MKDGRFEGVSCWESTPTTLETIILRRDGKELAIDFNVDNYRFTVVLNRNENGKYEGEFTRTYGGEIYRDKCSCKLFEDEEGIFIFGRWKEDGANYTWWAECQSLE